jgi:hypothetical protein
MSSTAPLAGKQLVDANGVNLALRTLLDLLSHYPDVSVVSMRERMARADWNDLWPDFVSKAEEGELLTPVGAQQWVRHLVKLESQPAPVAFECQMRHENGMLLDWTPLDVDTEAEADAYMGHGARGNWRVVGSEITPWRQRMAMYTSADRIVNAIKEAADGEVAELRAQLTRRIPQASMAPWADKLAYKLQTCLHALRGVPYNDGTRADTDRLLREYRAVQAGGAVSAATGQVVQAPATQCDRALGIARAALQEVATIHGSVAASIAADALNKLERPQG